MDIELRAPKTAKYPNARTHSNTIRGHFGLYPVKGKSKNWRKAAGSYLIQ
jgi:hypothetical protein